MVRGNIINNFYTNFKLQLNFSVLIIPRISDQKLKYIQS